MKKLIIVLLVCFVGLKTNAQGINIGLGSGTEWLRLEAGYSLSENIHIGAQLAPGFQVVGIPAFYAGFFRYTFDDNEFGGAFISAAFRGYVGASAGLIRSKETTYGLTASSEPRSAIGISGNAGVEILYGRTGKFGSFFELSLGQVPNYFNTINTGLDNLYGNQEEVKLAAIWGFSAGIRFYFGN